MSDPDPRLLQLAVDDRAARPWNYYRLDHETSKKLLNEMYAEIERLRQAEPGKLQEAFIAGWDVGVSFPNDYPGIQAKALCRYPDPPEEKKT